MHFGHEPKVFDLYIQRLNFNFTDPVRVQKTGIWRLLG